MTKKGVVDLTSSIKSGAETLVSLNNIIKDGTKVPTPKGMNADCYCKERC